MHLLVPGRVRATSLHAATGSDREDQISDSRSQTSSSRERLSTDIASIPASRPTLLQWFSGSVVQSFRAPVRKLQAAGVGLNVRAFQAPAIISVSPFSLPRRSCHPCHPLPYSRLPFPPSPPCRHFANSLSPLPSTIPRTLPAHAEEQTLPAQQVCLPSQ